MTKEAKMFESSNAKEKFCSYYDIEKCHILNQIHRVYSP